MQRPDFELEMIERRLAASGGIGRMAGATSRQRRMLATAVDGGRLLRLRRGWYSLPHVDPSIRAAVRFGGSLTAVSAARLRGLWAIDDQKLHVAVSAHASGLRSSRDSRSICLHWIQAPPGSALDPVQRLESALVHLALCQPFDLAVATVDSALNATLTSLSALRAEFAGAPARCRQVLDWCDPASQSGTESLVRVRLRRRGIRVRTQVGITGVGFVDLLVGDRLVLECDSREFHDKADSFATDRARDLELTRQGYRVVRLTYAQVVYHWHEVEPAILDIVRSSAHLRPRRRA